MRPLENPLFDTVLVANRGEIACRVIHTLRQLGIRSVAVYSDDDAGARHVREADTAVRLGPAPARQSYLSVDAVLAACRSTGAQAVHPGYGFLSENADFARALEDAGITFIGPGVHSLDLMGDKIRAKNHVQAHGVPVVPGIAEPGLDDTRLLAAAADVGYPILIKPSAGGGGKGMQAVEHPEDLPAALQTARRVAASAFGDDTLFLERLVSSPRHIEVQVLADTHGNVIHLGERECSLQRRHQKVIEEAPSVLLDPATRERIGQAACDAARSVDYTGAGTVEFLVSDASPDEFFFMEMNTRLQVEHPVTEMVTGVDLVAEQVRIAAGRPLSLKQEDVVLTGHAVEARIYAEDPARDFLPTSGSVQWLSEPSGEGIRVDSSLLPGLAVSSSYDPMLAKVIAWGPDRAAALARLDTALAGTAVLGIGTNVEYLRLLLADPDVRAGRLDTTLIQRRLPGLRFRAVQDPELAAAALLHLHSLAGSASPWQRADGWRVGGAVELPLTFAAPSPEGADVEVGVTGTAAQARLRIAGGPVRSAALLDAPGTPTSHPLAPGSRVQLSLDGVQHTFTVAAEPGSGALWLAGDADTGPFTVRLRVRSRREQLDRQLAEAGREAGTADPVVRSPMPGTVVAVAVADGTRVSAGDPLLSVEAMKMEHQLRAPVDGVVSISLAPGDLVKADQVLATLTPEPVPAGDEPSTGPATAVTPEGADNARL
ncbi:biotin/lipoyl-binding protein [Arthrobacter zhangbolii]|uniref:Biotin-dependent 3-methylcrotonyl-coenzyme A carboxylase alpha1 subunit n=1 Tax=Arthrobacter zhangbolii TaxID=2886936 RepID=A0A9X1M7W6_9MICC|nr:biotin carboxylase N-terminal domain-containing protein [Arthrobacter zhangbolii]MCC3273093.1 biotin/lipoyl-binding protein [Arthrobacter zhangbolii]UON93134.1 biotin/lipoyl-binding protein [Arthrobacter zhangbolii]